MWTLRVGNAPCSWGTLEFEETKGNQVPFGQMLDELSETGYTGTELGDWGYMPTNPAILKAELDRRRLAMLGAFVPVALKDPSAYEAGLAAALQVAQLLAKIATEPMPYLVLSDNNGSVPERVKNAGRITPPYGLNASEWKTFAANANKVAQEIWNRTALKTVFHHHCAGYVETPDEIAQFLKLTDPKLIGLVFDTGHYVYGSGNCNVVEGLERFKDRIWYVHFKDFSSSISVRARSEKWDYFQALQHGIFCELGRGEVDFPAVLRWLKRNGYDGYIVVEQDILPGMGEPKESARRNRDYLRSIEGNSA
jgi:inosose dehydratase